MKNPCVFRIIPFCLLWFLGACAERSTPAESTPELRLVSLDGAITEVLFELGLGDQVVGVDVTSVYPKAAQSIDKLGHITQLNVEGILTLSPDVIFAEDTPEARKSLEKLVNAAVVRLVFIPQTSQLDNAVRVAHHVTEALALQKGTTQHIASRIAQDSLSLMNVLSGAEGKPSVLFLYARGTGRLLVAGAHTDADAVIRMAGGKNAVQGFEGFKVLSPEFLLAAQPEVILMFESGLASLDGKSGLSGLPGMAETPAFRNGRIIAMDGAYLLGFGPRQAEAVKTLALKLHGVEKL